MSCKPIVFTVDEVRATHDGRKIMKRMPIVPQPSIDECGMWHWRDCQWMDGGIGFPASGVTDYARYQPGDILWVREKWRAVDFEYCDCKWSASIEYADGARGIRVFWYDNSDVGIPSESLYEKTGWRPSIFMPKDAARIFLRVTAVRAERLQEIREEDAIREGIMYTDFGMDTNRGSMSIDGGVTFHPLRPEHHPGFHAGDAMRPSQCLFTARSAFGSLWDDINAKRAGGAYAWDKNPWVWVISFERADRPEGWPEVQHA